MKKLNNYITEKLKLSKRTIQHYTCQPKNAMSFAKY